MARVVLVFCLKVQLVTSSSLLFQVYLLILSVTTLSLLMAPIVWRATLWQLRIKHRRYVDGGPFNCLVLKLVACNRGRIVK